MHRQHDHQAEVAGSKEISAREHIQKKTKMIPWFKYAFYNASPSKYVNNY